MKIGRKKSEKGKLEGQELQFFLSTSDNRLQRVKSGARLFNVIKMKEANRKPLQLIEHVVTKQSVQDLKLTKEEKNQREQELKKLLEGEFDMVNYLRNTKFDPLQEIIKEKSGHNNIEKFFKQKYSILMMYLEDDKKSKKPKSVKRKFSDVRIN